MESYKYIDRFFDSSLELIGIAHSKERNGNTLFLFLNNLHSLNDRLKKDFGRDLFDYPEFILLKILRNYFHHEGDVNEIRVFFDCKNIVHSHLEMIIVPTCTIAKSLIQSFNGKSSKNRKKEEKALREHYKYHNLSYVLDDLERFANDPKLLHKGKFYSSGFDLYIAIYNVTNIIASLCQDIPELSSKQIIQELDETYDINNNINKNNLMVHPGNIPILTTEGFIFLN